MKRAIEQRKKAKVAEAEGVRSDANAAEPKPQKRSRPRPKPKKKSEIPTKHAERVEAIVYLMVKNKWVPRQSAFELSAKWGCSLTAISRAADHASVRIRTAEGELHRQILEASDELDEIKAAAMAAGQFSAAVRAVEQKVKIRGLLTRDPLGRGKGRGEEDQPQGLPPELAQLSPPPSFEEVAHFAEVAPNDCTFETCRVHAKTPARAGEMH